MCRRALITLLPVAIAVANCLALTAPATASAAPVVTIHLRNAPSYCVDVKDGHDTLATWYGCTVARASDDHWYELSASDCLPFGCGCRANCFKFEDVRHPSLCLGLSVTQRDNSGL